MSPYVIEPVVRTPYGYAYNENELHSSTETFIPYQELLLARSFRIQNPRAVIATIGLIRVSRPGLGNSSLITGHLLCTLTCRAYVLWTNAPASRHGCQLNTLKTNFKSEQKHNLT